MPFPHQKRLPRCSGSALRTRSFTATRWGRRRAPISIAGQDSSSSLPKATSCSTKWPQRPPTSRTGRWPLDRTELANETSQAGRRGIVPVKIAVAQSPALSTRIVNRGDLIGADHMRLRIVIARCRGPFGRHLGAGVGAPQSKWARAREIDGDRSGSNRRGIDDEMLSVECDVARFTRFAARAEIAEIPHDIGDVADA